MDATLFAKPLVENTQDIKNLKELELYTGKKTFSILQLRHHPVIKKLKKEIDRFSKKKHNVELTYITGRGPWYDKSWKIIQKKLWFSSKYRYTLF